MLWNLLVWNPLGGLTALNSYENRVYQMAMEDGSICHHEVLPA